VKAVRLHTDEERRILWMVSAPVITSPLDVIAVR
jgi:hypothetical protein